MDFVWFLLIGVIGGVLGGMGMGGGTLLIPLLTLVMGLTQHFSQAINLISFIPMSIIALIIHTKNKLTNFKLASIILLFGLIGAYFGANFANEIEENALKIYFGIFLTILGIFSLTHSIFINKNQ